jgi:hypothetical protein
MGELQPTMIIMASDNQVPVRENQKAVQQKIEAAAADGQLFMLLTDYASGEGFTVMWSAIEIICNARKQVAVDAASGVPLLHKR